MGKVEEKDMPAAPLAPGAEADDAAAHTPAVEPETPTDAADEEMKNI